MFLIDVASAAPALPTPAAPGLPGYFTDGDVVGGEQATVLSADFMNMVMMELYNVVLAAGAAPSKTTYTQIRDAIGLMGSFGTSGWVKLPMGLILQWGQAPAAFGNSQELATVTFPIAFPSQLLCVGGNPNEGANDSWGALITMYPDTGLSLTGMQIIFSSTDGTQFIIAGRFARWFAIGK